MKDVQRLEIVAVIDQLLAGSLSREAASRWAVERDGVDVGDETMMEALGVLVICDEQEYDLDVPGTPVPLCFMVDLDELAEVRDRLAT